MYSVPDMNDFDQIKMALTKVKTSFYLSSASYWQQHGIISQLELPYFNVWKNSICDDNDYFMQITDAVYACEFVGCFDQILFKMIEKDLSMMLNLHSFFLKFRSMLDKPLDRVSQNHRFSILVLQFASI